jgi:hypothetical protein
MKTKSRPYNERGSLLIVAMIFSAIVAICLTSYIQMARTAMTVSQRAFYNNNAMNMTETGLEMAINSINNNSWGSPWTCTGANATATFTGFSFGQGATGQVQVYVQNYATTAPFLVAKGKISPPRSAPVIKMVEVTGVVNRSLFAKGMVGKNGVSFTGNASVDAWNSNPTNAAPGTYAPVAYSSATKVATGSVAAVSVTADVTVQNADIYGTASVGASNVSNITVGPNGSVGTSFSNPAGNIDPNSVSGNFTANLPNATNPTIPSGYTPPTIATITGTGTTASFPRGTDTAASDGTYYYNVGAINPTGNNTLSITAPAKVVFIVTAAAGTTGVSISGNQAINVASTATVAIYTASNISIAGNGVANSNLQPSTFQVYGTAASGQTVAIAGNGVLSAIVYAPNADISVKGGGTSGSVYGAMVGNTVTMVGNGEFHYDLSLANMNGNPLFQPSKWVELVSASDRATYATQLP